jgi:hypothetical protein
METKTFYNEVLTDHNMHPYHKHDIDNADLELEGVNPSSIKSRPIIRGLGGSYKTLSAEALS